nr:2798_t:CDS:2 [Entrophospora candida]CAG8568531.1 1518_t:CDS:2 [Entrophospora candida]
MTEYLNKLLLIKYKDESLKDHLVKFIISHSCIERLNTSFLKAKMITNHPKLRDCFQNLKQLETTDDYSPNFFIVLSDVCNHIQTFKLHLNNMNKHASANDLASLIKNQNKVKKIHTYLPKSTKSGELCGSNLKNAILSHSNSMVEYHSTGN